MASLVTLADLRAAHQTRDPELVSLFLRMLEQEDERKPIRDGAYTFAQYLADQQSPSFKQLSLDEQARFRMERTAQLEAEDADPPLDEKLRCHEVLWELWQDDQIFSRRCLLELIAKVPLRHGPFKALKRIFKAAEQKNDTEVYGALGARFDMAFADRDHQVSHRTMGYLVRRAWRYLRRIGEGFPAIYADVATDFLIHYEEYGDFSRSWILNHIFFHELGAHSRTKFDFFGRGKRRTKSWSKHRAFAEAWKRSPRPLFTLLERSKSLHIIRYAASALKSDFRSAIRDVEPSWVSRLISRKNQALDEFAVWTLENVPRFEQAKFRELGLHDTVVQLFYSDSPAAQKYAVNYARTHARDLAVEELIILANAYNESFRKFANDLLQSRDPRKEIGLDAWRELLNTHYGFEIAKEALAKHFGASELTPEWFAELLGSSEYSARQFAEERLLTLHSRDTLGWKYFVDVVDSLDNSDWSHHYAGRFCCEQLERLSLKELPEDALQILLMHPTSQDQVCSWIERGKLKPTAIGTSFLKAVAYRPEFETSETIQELKRRPWGEDEVYFSEGLATIVLGWMRDVRQFSPSDLGFDWLLSLVQRTEAMYHSFAVDTLTRGFLPADFADASTDATDNAAADDDSTSNDQADETSSPEAESSDSEIQVDLQGDTFVFTGKLQTMSRSEAQKKVTAAGGANSSSVTKKLKFLVIGDEGSPLYGQGRKGSKQTKAEKLNEEGAEIQIISERAFLQMLAGEQREFSADDVQTGCERLWAMMVDGADPDAPLSRFARTYIRHHHKEICLAETDRPVDPGAEMPDDFMTFDRFLPLFSDSRKALRDVALEFARWELARWAPPIEGIVAMCDSPYPEVREFVSLAITADESPDHRRYRIDTDVLTPDAVYSFCESRIKATRQLGMQLISSHQRLMVPDELFRLTESPDGAVRGFVIRTFWSLYRDRGTTDHWKPRLPVETSAKKKRRKKPIEADIGTGAPARPKQPPAEWAELQALLRRILFELPPGRPPIKASAASAEPIKLKPIPARQAKLKLVDTLRDLAIEDSEFAELVLPLLREFKSSRGDSERAACIVAVTRIEHHHGDLREPAATL